MATIQDIKQRAQQVKDATQIGENTANRVGGVLVDMADHLEQDENQLSSLYPADAVPTAGSVKPVQSGGVYEQLSTMQAIDLSQEPYTNVITSENTWRTHTNANGHGYIIPIEAGKTYQVDVDDSSEGSVIIALLTTNRQTPSGSTPDFCENYQGRIVIQVGTSYNFTAPVDANYLYILAVGANSKILIYTFSEVFSLKEQIKEIETNLEETNEALDKRVSVESQSFTDEEKEQARENINAASIDDVAIWNQIAIPSITKWTDSRACNVIVRSNLWQGKTTPYFGYLLAVQPGNRYKIEAISSAVCAFLKSDAYSQPPGGNTPDYCDGYVGRTVLNANTSFEFVAPSDMQYLYLTLRSSSNYLEFSVYVSSSLFDKINEVIEKIENLDIDVDGGDNVKKRIADSIGNALTPLSIPVDVDGYEIPTTREILNVQKKSKQMTDIVWTPLADIPYQGTGGVFPANVPVTGLPYSSVKEIDKYIGYDVSIHTFMTAINNPYSLLYTECILKSRSASAWGRVYNGVDHCAAYMGTVCSVLSGYGTGQVVQWPTGEDKWCAEINLNMVKVYEQNAQGLRIGDIIWIPGHNRLVVGLKRDSNGEVTHVQITESTGSHVRQNADITAQTFNNRLANEGGIIYRNIEIYKNRYVPSEFVAVGDETITPYVYNDDICTFAGDKATFRESDLIVLNYNLKLEGNWTAIKVFKDDVLVATYQLSEIDQSELPEGQRNHALELGSSHTYGQYKACMTDGTTDSEFTYWEVLETNVSYQKLEDTSRIEWSSENGKPLSWTICNISGTVYAHNEFSIEDIANGYLDINLVKFNQQQYPSKPFVEGMYLKIHFEGSFGRVTNEPFVIEV